MKQIKQKIKAIIFDMDGTIINTEDMWKNVTLDVLAKHGVTTFGAEEELFLKNLSGMNIKYSSSALKSEFKLDATVQEIIDHTIHFGNVHLNTNIEFIEGFEFFHRKLQEHGIPSGIATNAHPSNLKGIAERLEFVKFFGTNIYTPANVNNTPKPAPDLFLHTAAQLGVDPSECVVFEDSIYGFQAAKAAGMKCIAIKNNLNKDLMDQVHGSINNYHEAEEALKKI